MNDRISWLKIDIQSTGVHDYYVHNYATRAVSIVTSVNNCRERPLTNYL